MKMLTIYCWESWNQTEFIPRNIYNWRLQTFLAILRIRIRNFLAPRIRISKNMRIHGFWSKRLIYLPKICKNKTNKKHQSRFCGKLDVWKSLFDLSKIDQVWARKKRKKGKLFDIFFLKNRNIFTWLIQIWICIKMELIQNTDSKFFSFALQNALLSSSFYTLM